MKTCDTISLFEEPSPTSPFNDYGKPVTAKSSIFEKIILYILQQASPNIIFYNCADSPKQRSTTTKDTNGAITMSIKRPLRPLPTRVLPAAEPVFNFFAIFSRRPRLVFYNIVNTVFIAIGLSPHGVSRACTYLYHRIKAVFKTRRSWRLTEKPPQTDSGTPLAIRTVSKVHYSSGRPHDPRLHTGDDLLCLLLVSADYLPRLKIVVLNPL